MNINIATILNVKEKPTKCVKCPNTKLDYNVVKANTGNPSHNIPVKNADNAYCSECSTLMIVYSE